MSKRILYLFMAFASFLIVFGILIAFIDLKIFCIDLKNDGYVGAIFSLAGILLYFTALMYQIKEYQLQVVELKKSVQAQTKSSEALDEQKRILIEQNNNSLIFGMIESFNDFKERNNIQKVINELVNFYQGILALRWNTLVNSQLNKVDLNRNFANDIKHIFSDSIVEQKNFSLFNRYVQFVYNILGLIDSCKSRVFQDNFIPFLFNQLNTNETMLLFLSNLVDSEMPYYDNLSWGYYETKDITDIIKKYKHQNIDFSNLDNKILTEEFNQLKQRR